MWFILALARIWISITPFSEYLTLSIFSYLISFICTLLDYTLIWWLLIFTRRLSEPLSFILIENTWMILAPYLLNQRVVVSLYVQSIYLSLRLRRFQSSLIIMSHLASISNLNSLALRSILSRNLSSWWLRKINQCSCLVRIWNWGLVFRDTRFYGTYFTALRCLAIKKRLNLLGNMFAFCFIWLSFLGAIYLIWTVDILILNESVNIPLVFIHLRWFASIYDYPALSINNSI